MQSVTVVRDEHLGRRAKAKAHYDKSASRDLSPLAPGQFVYTRPNDHHRGDRWRPGEVLGEVTPRSYVIQTQDGLVRRNPGGLLNKVQYGEAPPRGPTPYHLYTIWAEKAPLLYIFYLKRYHFHIPSLGSTVLIFM